jgi:ABC-type transport system involved in multi-copper enzyme maturation permease subunit
MLIGPIFTQELATAPLRTRFYALPALFLGAQLLLVFAAWMLLAGTQELRTPADFARFGMTIFPILVLLQLTLGLFFSALFTASAIAQEKDRRTLILLLLTRLNNSELVLGRLFASLLPLAVAMAVSVPLLLLLRGFGGISLLQIALAVAVTFGTMLVAGSLGALVAYWREKSFLILAITTLVICVWLGFWTAVGAGLLGETWNGQSTALWAATFSPLQTLSRVLQPLPLETAGVLGIGSVVLEYLIFTVVASLLLNSWTILRLRVWNPSREAAPRQEEAPPETKENSTTLIATPANIHAATQKTRPVWDNPILWREVRTWAYGRRMLLVKFAYVVAFAAACYGLIQMRQGAVLGTESLAAIVVPLLVVSLVLLNALAVNSITNEKDLNALDLLLVTDLSPREFIYGKLAGIFYAAKEMVVLPWLLVLGLWMSGAVRGEYAVYLGAGLLAFQAYVTMLGVHVGLAYDNSRQATAVSLGIVFFLLVGVGTCMRIMIAFGTSSLAIQMIAFSAVIIFGGVILYAALGVRNPSGALLIASLLSPALTFIGIMNYLGGETLSVFFVIVGAYGFATTAMLVPAIAAFDVATGRTTE